MRPQTSVNSSQSKIYDNSKSFRIMDKSKLRSLPQQMLYDKEWLYDENLRLKQQIQDLKFELKKERQDHANFEKIVAKTNEQQRDFQLILQQRTRIKEQNKIIKELEDAIHELKRNPERTKRQELEVYYHSISKIQLEEIKDSYSKMQLLLSSKTQQDTNETQLANKSLKEQVNVDLLQAYKQDNINLSNFILDLQHQNNQLNKEYKIIKTEKDRTTNRLKELEKQFESVNKHMIYMRQEMQNVKKQVPQEDLLLKIEDLIEQNNLANKMISTQKKQIEDLELKNDELQHSYEIFKSVESKEKDKLQDRISMLKKQIDDIQMRNEKSDSESSIKQSQYQQIPTTGNINNNGQSKKCLLKVNNYDIAELINRLKLEMIVRNVEFSVQEDAICEEFEEEVALDQMMERLQDEPFNLNSEESMIVARYLIEDNTEDHIVFDPHRIQTKAIIKSVYKKLIGDYQLFFEEEKNNLHSYFQQLFHKFSSGMESAIKQCTIKKKHLGPNNCEQEDFNEALKYCDIILTNRQRLYLDLIIFQQQGSLNKINYANLFTQFKMPLQEINEEQND